MENKSSLRTLELALNESSGKIIAGIYELEVVIDDIRKNIKEPLGNKLARQVADVVAILKEVEDRC